MSRTTFALWLYYLAIVFLTICAVVIVVKLIVFPPCAPRGNTCVVDPWSAAGLEGAVLGVSATVLAILGAVAVAGWWTSLNTRVKDQVGVLYEAQKKEARKDLADFLTEQQREVSNRLGTVQNSLQSVESRISGAATEIDELEKLTHDVEEMVIDGFMLMGAGMLEDWAKKALLNHRFPKVPAKMTESYLDSIQRWLASAEESMARNKNSLNTAEQRYKDWSSPSPTGPKALDPNDILSSQRQLNYWLDESTQSFRPINTVLANWEGVLRWLTITKDEKTDEETLRRLEEEVAKYQPRIEHLQQERDQLVERTPILLQQITSLLIEKRLISM